MEKVSAARSKAVFARKFTLALSMLLGLAFLPACGGGGGGGGEDPPPDSPAAPTILVQPGDLSVAAGQSAVFSATVTGVAVTYRWQRSTDGLAWADIPAETGPVLSLAAVSLDDRASHYRVVVSNAGGDIASRAGALDVRDAPAAPLFVREPVAAEAVVGERAVFSADVLGAKPADIRWEQSVDRERWTPVAGAQGKQLATAPLTDGDNGTYFRAAATNSQGAVYSDTARLRVVSAHYAPSYDNTYQPKATLDLANGDMTVMAQSFAAPGPSFVWQVSSDGGKNFVDLAGAAQQHVPTTTRSGSPPFDGVVYSRIKVPRSSFAHRGLTVRALISNSAGTYTSETVELGPIAGPTILSPPSAQSGRAETSEALFEVRVAGSSPTFQWQASRDGGASYSDIPGATQARYIHSGNGAVDHIRVVVSDDGQSVTSAAAELFDNRWETVHPRPVGEGLRSLAWVNPTTALAVGDRGSIIRSHDGGSTWSVVSDAPEGPSPRAVAVNKKPGGSGTALTVDASRGIRRSTDGGIHWAKVAQPYNFHAAYGTSFHGVAFSDASTAVAVGQGIVFSRDDGQTWTPAVTSGYANYILHAVAFNSRGVGVAVGDSGAILRSIDGGAHWWTVGKGLADRSLNSVAFASDQVVLVAGNDGTLLRSADGGATWAILSDAFQQVPGSHLNAVTMMDSLHGALASSEGLYLTSDGGRTWAMSLPTGLHQAVAYGPQGSLLAVGARGLIRLSTSGQGPWTTVAEGAAAEGMTAIAFANPLVGLAIDEVGGAMRTSDGGSTWSAVDTGMPSLRAIAFASTHTGVVIGGEVGGFDEAARTTDAGQTWTALPPVASFMYDVTFSSTTNGLMAASDGLYRSVDAGVTWSLVHGGGGWRAVRFGNATNGMALGLQGQLLRTADGGATWTPINAPEGGPFEQLWFVDAQTVILHRGSSNRLARSTDSGTSWSLVSPGFDVAHAAFADSSFGLAVDDAGQLHRTADGGLTWHEEYWGGSFESGGIAFADSHTVLAVHRGGHEIRRATGY